MLATSARMVPDIALAWLELPSALHFSSSPSFSMPTFGSIERAMLPSGPLTEIWVGVMVTSTPFGSGMGFLAIRDMALSSGDDADHFAADTGGARLAITHDALRGRDDRDTQAVHHARQVVAPLVDAQARLGDALQALDHGLAGVVAQADAQLLLAVGLAHREVLDVALVLEHLGDGGLQVRAGHAHLHLPHHLGIADTGQHVGNRVGHAHRGLLTSSP